MNPVVPEGEGSTVVVGLRVPKKLLADIDEMAKATHNPRSETMLHMLRWARDAYRTAQAAEQKQSSKAR